MAKGIGWLRKVAARFYFKHHGFGEPQDREVDLSLGHPSAGVLVQHIAERRWADCESLFLSLRADERSVLLSYAVEQDLAHELFDEWHSRSESHVAGLFRGTAMTRAAWEVRSSARGTDVPEEDMKQFHVMLEECWNNLYAAHEAAPDDPEPLARLVTVSMGLETGADDIRELVARCVGTGVPHLAAGLSATVALSAKWAGSQQQALEFAHAYAEENPHDRAVIACAHVENWFWHVMEDQHEQADKYFTRHDVQRDLRECWGRETRMAARTDYFRFPALNYYAWCLIQMQEEEMAREALDCMGAGVMERPWHYQTDKPVLLVNTARSHLDLPQI
jgi:hypothetical protein